MLTFSSFPSCISPSAPESVSGDRQFLRDEAEDQASTLSEAEVELEVLKGSSLEATNNLKELQGEWDEQEQVIANNFKEATIGKR